MGETREHIIDLADSLIRKRGFNAFSYSDIATILDIRNAAVHQEICDDIAAFAASLGCTDIQVFPSSITGGDGNIEFFLGARRG